MFIDKGVWKFDEPAWLVNNTRGLASRSLRKGTAMILRLTASAALAALCVLGPAAAQSPTVTPAPAEATAPVSGEEADIAVRAERLRDAVRGFVDGISEPGKEGQLARWDRTICPGILGARALDAQKVLDRVAQRVMALDLKVGEPGCKANVLIVVTPDSAAFTPQFVDQNPRLFATDDDYGNTRGGAALKDFIGTQRPVRWWHVGQTVTDRGQKLEKSDASASGTGDGFSGVTVARVSNAGRLTAGTRDDFNRAIVIVDSRASANVRGDQLADYIAMVTLAQLDPKADTSSADTILSLFSSGAAGKTRPEGLTEWDQAYLTGLYGAPRYARNARRQQNAITARVQDEVTKAPKGK
jgi:hypothetical protein